MPLARLLRGRFVIPRTVYVSGLRCLPSQLMTDDVALGETADGTAEELLLHSLCPGAVFGLVHRCAL